MLLECTCVRRVPGDELLSVALPAVGHMALLDCAMKKMVLFHIAAIGWISPQTGYEIQGSISTQN